VISTQRTHQTIAISIMTGKATINSQKITMNLLKITSILKDFKASIPQKLVLRKH
jgi:hypothetical protein